MRISPYKIYGFLSSSFIVILSIFMIKKDINPILSYIIAINMVTFLLYGYDKYISTINSNILRVPEKILHLLGLMGGSLSALIAQKFFRHKTKKDGFQLIFWGIIFIQIVIVLGILNYLK